MFMRALATATLLMVLFPLTVSAAPEGAVERLSAAIQIETIGEREMSPQGEVAFKQMHDLLARNYPQVWALREEVPAAAYSVLYRWPGTEPELAPIVLLAHMDVVPVDDASREQWTHPPFSGAIVDGSIWGRGALDDKSCVLSQLEAVNALMAAGFRPRRTVLLAHGHDEEVDGQGGALKIVEHLEASNEKAWFTLDEGGAVTRGVIDSVDKPVATIMAGEKGYLSVRVSAAGTGGHSSTPSDDTAIFRLANALAALEASPMPRRLIPAVGGLLDALAPEMPWAARVLINNRWLFESILLGQLEKSPTTAALLRTTMAPTMLMAGIKDNVLPNSADAVLNFRLLPGDGVDDVLQHIETTIDDPRVTVSVETGFFSEAPPLSDVASDAMQTLRAAVSQTFPEALVATGIVLATTDNRHYAPVRENGYYFAPFNYTPDTATQIHGIDEHIGVDEYLRMIEFYQTLIRLAAG